MAQPMITLVKSFNYRGSDEEWSNSYHLTDHPGSDSDWGIFADWIAGYEKTVYSSRVNILRALCFNDSSSIVTVTIDFADRSGIIPGTFPATTGAGVPGDVAGTVRWATGKRNSKGKPIYLRKYFHDCEVDGVPNNDTITSTQVTAYGDLADQLVTSIHFGILLADKDGDVPPGPNQASTFATTRTLKRRGRRP